MMPLEKVLIVILMVTAITFFTRLFPFIVLRKGEVPKFLASIEKNIPPAIMTVLVFYCLKDAPRYALQQNMALFGAIILSIALHLWKRNPLLSIFLSTILYMSLLKIFNI